MENKIFDISIQDSICKLKTEMASQIMKHFNNTNIAPDIRQSYINGASLCIDLLLKDDYFSPQHSQEFDSIMSQNLKLNGILNSLNDELISIKKSHESDMQSGIILLEKAYDILPYKTSKLAESINIYLDNHENRKR